MRVKHELAAHNQIVIKVQFDRQSPDADSPTLEVVYYVYFPEDMSLTDNTKVLVQRSVTRTDTRETMGLTDEENIQVMGEASEYAAQLGYQDF